MKVLIFFGLFALAACAPISLNDGESDRPSMDEGRMGEMRKHFCGNVTDEECMDKLKQHFGQVCVTVHLYVSLVTIRVMNSFNCNLR